MRYLRNAVLALAALALMSRAGELPAQTSAQIEGSVWVRMTTGQTYSGSAVLVRLLDPSRSASATFLAVCARGHEPIPDDASVSEMVEVARRARMQQWDALSVGNSTTDRDGRFVFRGVSAGNYVLAAAWSVAGSYAVWEVPVIVLGDSLVSQELSTANQLQGRPIEVTSCPVS